MYKHILIPTDGSALSVAAVARSLRFAKEIGAKATILTVVEPFHVFSAEIAQLENTRVEYERRAADQAVGYLADAEAKAKSVGVPCEFVTLQSDRPYQCIIDAAAERGCDLIAMASHGRRGVAAVLLGSETLKVLTHSVIPVLVYR